MAHAKQGDHTLADYIVQAISPTLIMALVGSLVFFLLDILYQGLYQGALQWLLFFFVFGAVLVARISMQQDIAGRASVYGAVLGLLVWIGLLTYVKYPPGAVAEFAWAINLGLIALIWWCAHQLTWDCTFIDEKLGSSGQGVLQAAGLDQSNAEAKEEKPKEKTKEGFFGWLDRWQKYREKRREKRTPGVWVVYFSLAALPIFGLGQAFIPAEESGRRRYVFWLMAIYVASGLGLLMTTSFLGLRNYLRQRKVTMPTAMAGTWLFIGCGLILALLTVGTFLPRPAGEYQVVEFDPLGSGERKASKYNARGEETGKGEGDRSAQGKKGEPGQGNQAGNKDGQKPQPGKDGKPGNQGQGSQGGNQGNQGNQGNKDGKDGKDGKQPGNKEKEQEQGGRVGHRGEEKNDGTAREKSERSSPSTPEWLKKIAPIMKWIVFGIIAIVVAFFLIRAILQFLANFTGWASNLLAAWKRFWDSLFGIFNREGATETSEEAVGDGPPPQPYSSYSNPYSNGMADRMSMGQLVRYSFAALQAWAWERGLGRQKGETPLEFTARLGSELPALDEDAGQLTLLFVRAVYARGALPPEGRAAVEKFWAKLQAVELQPLSA